MAVNVVVPAVGESVQEGLVYKWHKENGAYVEMDDVLVELETDKATVEIVAEVSGIFERLKNEGDAVKVGDVLARIDTSAAKPNGSAPAVSAQASVVEPAKPIPAASTSAAVTEQLSPAVGRMVQEHKLDPNAISGTGRGGRLTKEDVVNFIDKGATAPKPAAPAVSKSPTTASVAPAKPSTGTRAVRREKMSMLRRRIAERLLDAQRTNAILTTFNEVDMTAVMELRKQYKDQFKDRHGVGLGFMSFFVKAAVEALKEFPRVNGYIDGDEIVLHDYQDIGVAVSTDRGLMVPIVRNADSLSFADVERVVMDFAMRGRAGKLGLDELSGGTFTVTNGGVFGSLLSTPIINPPQSAILGMHKIEQRAVVIDGAVVARPMMYLAMSYDHRIIDGKEAVGFLVKIKDCIEDPTRLLLGV
jgi:2-oxoglutarate dehydrogenase E2 component (dihydrolipoamide succinyltransferase)